MGRAGAEGVLTEPSEGAGEPSWGLVVREGEDFPGPLERPGWPALRSLEEVWPGRTLGLRAFLLGFSSGFNDNAVDCPLVLFFFAEGGPLPALSSSLSTGYLLGAGPALESHDPGGGGCDPRRRSCSRAYASVSPDPRRTPCSP